MVERRQKHPLSRRRRHRPNIVCNSKAPLLLSSSSFMGFLLFVVVVVVFVFVLGGGCDGQVVLYPSLLDRHALSSSSSWAFVPVVIVVGG